jgi:hypothetical protein
MDYAPEEIGAWQQKGFAERQRAAELNIRAGEKRQQADRERDRYTAHIYDTEGPTAAEEYLCTLAEQERLRNTSVGKRVLNTVYGTAANFLSGVGNPLVLLSRVMELPEDLLYAVTKEERFNQDNPKTHPGGRNSTALRESDPFAEAAREASENVGWLGKQLIRTGYSAGNLLSSSGIAGSALGALGSSGLTGSLESIADSSPLLTSASRRLGARAGLEIMNEAIRHPGNVGISLGSGVNSYSEALEKGATYRQAMTNGLTKALTEYASNKLFGGTPFEDSAGEAGYVTGLMEYMAGKLGLSEALRSLNASTGGKVVSWFFDRAGEGLEEVVTKLADPLIDRLTYDRTADLATAEELTEEFVCGSLLSLLLTGGKPVLDAVTGEDAEREVLDYLALLGVDKDAARPYVPELVRTVEAARETAEKIDLAGENADAATDEAEELDIGIPARQDALTDGLPEDIVETNHDIPPVTSDISRALIAEVQARGDKISPKRLEGGSLAIRDKEWDERYMKLHTRVLSVRLLFLLDQTATSSAQTLVEKEAHNDKKDSSFAGLRVLSRMAL